MVVVKDASELSIKSHEDGMISLAEQLAERQLKDGTASPLVIAEYIKRGSTQQQLNVLKLQKEIELLEAKTEAIKSQKSLEEIYKKAIEAMRVYQGNMGDGDKNDPDVFRS